MMEQHVLPRKSFSLPLFLSPFISQLGNGLYLFGLNWFVVKATGNAALLGIVEAIGGFVFFLSDFFCGVLIDNYNRRYIVIASEMVSFLACMILVWFINPLHPTAAQLITLTVFVDIGLGFSFPAAKAIVPEVLKPESLQRFNAISNTVFSLADILAPLVGGVMLAISWIDFREFLFINGLAFGFSMLLFIILRYTPEPRSDERLGFMSSLKSGLRYVASKPALVENILLSGVGNVIFAATRLVIPYDVTHFYQGNANFYSYVLTGMAIGGILGGVRLSFSRSEKIRRDNYIDLFAAATLLIIAGLIRLYVVLLIFAAVYGFFMASFNIRAFTYTQTLTENQFLGRVFGIWFLAIDGIQPMGSLMFGFVIDWIQNWTFLVLGVILALVMVLLRWIFQSKVNGLHKEMP